MSTLDVLNEVAEFLEGQSDVRDGDDGVPQPNKAMSLLADVEREIERLQERAVMPDPESKSPESDTPRTDAAILKGECGPDLARDLERKLRQCAAAHMRKVVTPSPEATSLTTAEMASVARFLRIAAKREQDATERWLGHQQKQVDLAIKIEASLPPQVQR